MSPLAVGFGAIVLMMLLALFGVPVGVAVALVAGLGMIATTGVPYSLVTFQSVPYAALTDYAFIVVPMFILMGNIAWRSGIIEEMFNVAAMWMARARGALFYAVTLASAGFSAVSGSTVANAAVFTRIVLPEMLRLGYDRKLTTGCVAAAGTFAVLIPPSLAFVLYAIMTGESVGRLFMAGVFPGLLTAAAYMAALRLLIWHRPELAPEPIARVPLGKRVKALQGLWGILALVAVVLGGIYTGIVPPSAAGAVGAVGALLIALLRRRMSWAALWDCVARSAVTTASLFFIVISGFLFSRFLISAGFVPQLTALVSDAEIGKWEFLAIMVAVYIVLGMFIDGASMAVVTLPFVYPIAQSLGIDGIWFGVIFVKLVEIGAITPPIGINLFAVISASDGTVQMSDVIRGIWPFIVVEACVFAVILAVPALSTWLPGTMF
ncbi:TRAP transporter large permease [Nitratireductor sp. ZSWI3]|uniref:TRAP transporter large permease n=1 Tax=Nitratireductor sp. ZSWI3 TaxID=2966359 RepID=UPI0021505923|nr:TRAP transporter large permease subunit [Nitratireductor sp. ZSWI3]MCR4265032.1 TRAP transporter large permease subunit [Nitratireductor sp. ZSWI3]